MKHPIIESDKPYTFHDYFKLDPPFDDLLAYFGYHRQVVEYRFPEPQPFDVSAFDGLAEQLKGHLQLIDLTSEIARRETLIAPILFKIALHIKMRVNIEYPVNVNHQLKGKIDYYMRHSNNLLIVEAKQGDLQRGFTQLAVELIALDKWLDEDTRPIYGIITMGNVWQFGILDRQTKLISQDLNLFRVPADLTELLQILLTILTA